MIVEDEKEEINDVLDLKENLSVTIVIPLEVHTNDNPDPSYAEALRINLAIKARLTHRQLEKDLIVFIFFIFDIIQSNSHTVIYTNVFVVDLKLYAKY
jgi:hypothetical protein